MLNINKNGWTKRPRRRQTIEGGNCKLGVKDIPGPLSLPVIGTRWMFTKIGPYDLPQLHVAYRDMSKIYGPIVKEEALFNVPVISLFDRMDIETVVRNSSRYPVRPPTEISMVYRMSRPDRYTNNGVVNEQGEMWNFLRTSLTKELSSTRTIMRFVPDLERVAEDFVDLLRARRTADNRVSDLHLIVKHLGLESTCALVLGRRVGALDREIQELGSRLAKLTELHFSACRDSTFGLLPLWKYFPTKIYTQYKQAEEELYNIISKFVEDALEDEEDTCNCDPVQKVFMSILHAQGLDIRDKKAAIVDFIASGIITLGNTLMFLLYHVAKNPHVQRCLLEELTSLASDDHILTAQELRNATYLNAVIKEVYRIQPTAIHVARVLDRELELSGYSLSAGTVILCHYWEACMKEENFSYAHEFIPERWILKESEGWNFSPRITTPFGFGRRKCPGENFTDQMLRLLLAKIVRDFRVEYKGELKTRFEFLVVPELPVNFIFHDQE